MTLSSILRHEIFHVMDRSIESDAGIAWGLGDLPSGGCLFEDKLDLRLQAEASQDRRIYGKPIITFKNPENIVLDVHGRRVSIGCALKNAKTGHHDNDVPSRLVRPENKLSDGGIALTTQAQTSLVSLTVSLHNFGREAGSRSSRCYRNDDRKPGEDQGESHFSVSVV